MVRRVVVLAALTAAVLIPSGPARADGTGVHHVFSGSPAGFIGCFAVVGGESGSTCLKAFQASGGLHLSYSGFPPEEAIDPNGSISIVTTPSGTGIRLLATLPTKGPVDITSVGGSAESGAICVCWTPTYAIAEDLELPSTNGPLKVRYGTVASGTIGNDFVASRYGDRSYEVNSHWIDGRVSGFYV